jgi:hypothetical protein
MVFIKYSGLNKGIHGNKSVSKMRPDFNVANSSSKKMEDYLLGELAFALDISLKRPC